MSMQISDSEYDAAGKIYIAALDVSVQDLESRIGIHFGNDIDDLDEIKLAFIRLQSGDAYALIHHAQSPENLVTVYGDPDGADLSVLARELGIPSSSVRPASSCRAHP